MSALPALLGSHTLDLAAAMDDVRARGKERPPRRCMPWRSTRKSVGRSAECIPLMIYTVTREVHVRAGAGEEGVLRRVLGFPD